MRNIISKYSVGLGAALMLLGITSCSNEDYLGGWSTTEGAGSKAEVTIAMGAAPSQSKILTFKEGDKIGLSASYGATDVKSRNRSYICGADGKTFTNDIDYPIYIKGTCVLAAYYPYNSEDYAEPTLSLNTTNQDNISDLYIGVSDAMTVGDSQANINLDYAYATLHITAVVPEGEAIQSFRLEGFSQTATIDPYSMEYTLDGVADLTGTWSGTEKTLTLIPQEIAEDAEIPAVLNVIGLKRSYVLPMGAVTLSKGESLDMKVDLTNGLGTVEFAHENGQWSDSGAGGNVSSN